ncbi:MAG: hypothetical protein ABIG28_02450 [archaeon]
MVKRKNKTVWGVVGVVLVLFGFIGTITLLVNREYVSVLPLTGLSVIVGVTLMAWAFSD